MAQTQDEMTPPPVGGAGAGPAGDTATEDMVVIQLPRQQLQSVVEAFKQITGMLEEAANKADSDIAAQQGAAEGEGAPAEGDMNSPEALAAEIEAMSRSR